jgi:chemotaxis protein methyltransferase CheR
MSPDRLRQFFLRGVGSNKGKVRVRPELTQAIHFFPLNLQQAHWPIEGRFDAIFCRNVLIYFNREDQERLIDRLTRMLNSDGILFLGHSENAQCMGKRVTLAGKTAYRLSPGATRAHEHA